RLLKERKYAQALAEAEVVVQKAPYLGKAKEYVINAACAAGEDDRSRAMMQKLFNDSTKPYEKVQRGVAWANWLFAEGKRKGACAMVGGHENQPGGSSSTQSPAGNWSLDRHELARATKKLEAELEKTKSSQSYYSDQIRPRLARVELASGAYEAAVSRHL